MHIRDEMAEKVQELEEELTMALSELKKAKDANKLLSDVSWGILSADGMTVVVLYYTLVL